MNTIGEAHAVNTLIKWILQDVGPYGIEVPTQEEACKAASYLAQRARRTGACMYSEQEVERLWNQKRPAITKCAR